MGSLPCARETQSTPLDPSLSISGAARADRILYSTLDQHGAPAVSTAPSSTSTFNDELVANGQTVELHVYPNQDHSGTVLASLPDSTPFLRAAIGAH